MPRKIRIIQNRAFVTRLDLATGGRHRLEIRAPGTGRVEIDAFVILP